AETPLRSHPQRGRVLPAWAFIGWRWVWRSPAAAIVPLLQPFFFLYFLHVIAPPELFPLQVAGAMLFSTQNIGSWCLSDSAVFRIELRLQDIFVASPVGNLIFTLLGILSPLYYPISRLPSGWGEIARLLPATYAALLVQGALGLERSTNFAVDGGLLILSAAVGLVAAWWLYEWRER